MKGGFPSETLLRLLRQGKARLPWMVPRQHAGATTRCIIVSTSRRNSAGVLSRARDKTIGCSDICRDVRIRHMYDGKEILPRRVRPSSTTSNHSSCARCTAGDKVDRDLAIYANVEPPRPRENVSPQRSPHGLHTITSLQSFKSESRIDSKTLVWRRVPKAEYALKVIE